MKIRFGPDERGHMQDTLRSVGAMLDLVAARAVLIRESDDGLVIRARVSPTLTDRIEGRTCPIERSLSGQDIARLRAEAVARRGTGHLAGPQERSLRMIGRHVDERHLRGVTLIQDETERGWLLWHERMEDARPALFLLVDDELRIADAKASDVRVREAVGAAASAA